MRFDMDKFLKDIEDRVINLEQLYKNLLDSVQRFDRNYEKILMILEKENLKNLSDELVRGKERS